jgi:hypothetical protein
MFWIKLVIGLLLISLASISRAECYFNSASALPLQLTTDAIDPHATRQLLLSHNPLLATDTAQAQLELRDVDSARLFGQLSGWSDTETQIDAANIMAEPALLDKNGNGVTDAVYVVDIQGRVWFIPLTSRGFMRPTLIADFSATGAKFRQPLQLVQSTYQVSHGQLGSFQQRKVSLVLIASHVEQGDRVILFNHQPQRSQLIHLSDLMDRTDLGINDRDSALTETVWRELQQSAGWFIQLEATVMLKPQVYAGVLYFATADSFVESDSEQTSCDFSTAEETRLFAVHLHHAGKVYAKRSWHIDAMTKAALQLNVSADKLQLSLVNETEHKEMIPELLAITADCLNCTAVLTASDFPRTLRLATYMAEYGAW